MGWRDGKGAASKGAKTDFLNSVPETHIVGEYQLPPDVISPSDTGQGLSLIHI